MLVSVARFMLISRLLGGGVRVGRLSRSTEPRILCSHSVFWTRPISSNLLESTSVLLGGLSTWLSQASSIWALWAEGDLPVLLAGRLLSAAALSKDLALSMMFLDLELDRLTRLAGLTSSWCCSQWWGGWSCWLEAMLACLKACWKVLTFSTVWTCWTFLASPWAGQTTFLPWSPSRSLSPSCF